MATLPTQGAAGAAPEGGGGSTSVLRQSGGLIAAAGGGGGAGNAENCCAHGGAGGGESGEAGGSPELDLTAVGTRGSQACDNGWCSTDSSEVRLCWALRVEPCRGGTYRSLIFIYIKKKLYRYIVTGFLKRSTWTLSYMRSDLCHANAFIFPPRHVRICNPSRTIFHFCFFSKLTSLQAYYGDWSSGCACIFSQRRFLGEVAELLKLGIRKNVSCQVSSLP